jgi:hypothetical protein
MENSHLQEEKRQSCITNSSFCSPWVYCDDDEQCKCGDIPNHILHCDTEKNISILGDNCLTYNEERNVTEMGMCMFTNMNNGRAYMVLPRSILELNEFVCGRLFNRTGTLCGRCKDDHYIQAYSFDVNCILCTNRRNGWWKYILAAYLPLTVFYLIVLLFKVNVAASNLFPFVLYAQAVSLPINARTELVFLIRDRSTQIASRWFVMLYGIWNLDFFRSFDMGICLGTNTLQTLALDIAVGIFPLLLLLLTYSLISLNDRKFRPIVFLWRPFQVILQYTQRSIESKTTLIDAFSTFFLLSNNKLLSSSTDLLVPVTVHEVNTTGHVSQSWRLFYDATIPYFGHQHLPYAILAIAVLVFFSVLPVLLLALYSLTWFQKLLGLLPVRWCNVLHTFVDSCHGCYKDGTEPGTSDYRWFASLFFGARYLLLVIGFSTYSAMYFPLAAMLLLVIVILLVYLQPFKKCVDHLNHLTATFLLLLAMAHVAILGTTSSREEHGMPLKSLLVVGVTLPLLYISAINVHWLYKNGGKRMIRRLRAWRQGYEILQ